jgi:DNA-binding NarL/FixJ family response regulator
MIRVLVADDQEPVRTGLRLLLESLPDIEVVGEAADGVEAVRLAQRLRPDVALLDIRMPGLNGIEATALLAGERIAEPIAVVIITTFDLDEYVHGALRAGAKGFLLKEAGPQLIGEAVRAAANGDALISPQITARLLGEFSRPTRRVREPSAPLTAREEDVLALLSIGLTKKRDRRAAVPVARHGQDPHRGRPHETRRAKSSGGRDVGVRVGPRERPGPVRRQNAASNVGAANAVRAKAAARRPRPRPRVRRVPSGRAATTSRMIAIR